MKGGLGGACEVKRMCMNVDEPNTDSSRKIVMDGCGNVVVLYGIVHLGVFC